MIPAIRKTAQGVPYLCVDGEPFPILGGELHNSAASDLRFMEKRVWPALRGLHMNTVLLPVSWESLEPSEGCYDFSLVTGLLKQARREGLRLVLLWFGLWKNGESFYAPEWVKTDRKRFFRTRFPDGPASNTISPFCREAVERDKLAFCQLMTCLKAEDTGNTVLMVQVENELGILGADRDYSPAAEAAYRRLIPDIVGSLYGKHGSWAEAFGEDAGEIFMAWHFAREIEAIAAAGSAVYPLPMYTNAWLEQHPDRAGAYPSGGPVAKLIPLWRATAPTLAMLSPDIYVPNFKRECILYAQDNNPLFIPEAARNPACVSKALYAFGAHRAFGFSPFGIEDLQCAPADEMTQEQLNTLNIDANAFRGSLTPAWLAEAYRLVREAYPRLLFGESLGFLQEHPYESGCMLRLPGFDVQLDYVEGRTGSGGVVLPEADGFFLIGCNVRFKVLSKSGSRATVEIIRYEEGAFAHGAWQCERILNGDERYDLRIGEMPQARRVQLDVVVAQR